MPLMGPGLSVVAIYTFIGLWGNFFVPFILLLTPEKLPTSVSDLHLLRPVRPGGLRTARGILAALLAALGAALPGAEPQARRRLRLRRRRQGLIAELDPSPITRHQPGAAHGTSRRPTIPGARHARPEDPAREPADAVRRRTPRARAVPVDRTCGSTWWRAPDEPVPFAEAVAQSFEPARSGCPGASLEHYLVPRHGAVPQDWRSGAGCRRTPGSSWSSIWDSTTSPVSRPRAWPGRRTASPSRRSLRTTTTSRSTRRNRSTCISRPRPTRTSVARGSSTGYGSTHPPPTVTRPPPATSRSTSCGAASSVCSTSQVWQLLGEDRDPRGLMRELPENLPRRAEILQALQRMLDVVDPENIAGTRGGSAGGAGRGAEPAGVRKRTPRSSPSATRTSTPPGCGRSGRPSASAPARSPTWSALADEHPDFRFACSSAQQYAWVKELYPELFDADQRAGRGRPVRPGRGHVGGGRHQHAGRRGDGPPVRGRQAVLPRQVRRRDPGGVAARLLRLLCGTAADRAGRQARSGS